MRSVDSFTEMSFEYDHLQTVPSVSLIWTSLPCDAGFWAQATFWLNGELEPKRLCVSKTVTGPLKLSYFLERIRATVQAASQ